MEKLPISLVIITLNEEKNIERCIRSVPFAGDIVVLDSGSTDRTVDIARRLGARTVQEPWRGPAKQRIRATALARYDWVLSLDADEALSAEAQNLILDMFKGEQLARDAYSFPRVSFYLNRWMYHSGMYPDYQTRLFHKERAKWNEENSPDKILAFKIEQMKEHILHWPYESVSAQVDTINRHSQLRAQDVESKERKFSTVKMLSTMCSRFFETYVVNRGYKDGTEGLLASFVACFATFLRWAKLYEHDVKQAKLSE